MNISNVNKENKGFTITELIVVVAGLAALASFAIPNVLTSIKLNRVEEAKAIMNSYAADCLGKYRISTDPANFIDTATPDQLDNTKLSTLRYQVDGDKNKCSHLAITPLDNNENDLFAFDFRMSSEGKILKTAIPSNNPRFLNSCRNWAGKNCGLSDAQIAEFARIAALAKAKSLCISNYNNWLNADNSGEWESWDEGNESCTRPVFAFEGVPVNSAEAVNLALEAKYGRACADWRTTNKQNNRVSPNGDPETLNPECNGINYWFHSGNEYTSQVSWNAFDNQLREQACLQDRADALNQGTEGQYTYGPTPGPDPCGRVVWLCNGAEYLSEAAYQTSTCYVAAGGGGGGGRICRNGVPEAQFVRWHACGGYPSLQNDPACAC